MNDIERALRARPVRRIGAIRDPVRAPERPPRPSEPPASGTPPPERPAPDAPAPGPSIPRAPSWADERPPGAARASERAAAIRLPMRELAAAGYLVPSTPKGRLTEQYRRIKRPLLRNLDLPFPEGLCPNIVMVTSSVPGEGKTYTAVNLAMSLALERDRTVLLIDADVIMCSATKQLGLSRDAPGLIDVLSGHRRDAGAVIRATDVPNLRFMPAGREDERSMELLTSVAMRDLMRELSSRYADRVIVLDCPPMLATNEAGAIAEHAGQVVFVVAQGSTAQRDVDEAIARFDPDRFVGVVVNRASGTADGPYPYGYD